MPGAERHFKSQQAHYVTPGIWVVAKRYPACRARKPELKIEQGFERRRASPEHRAGREIEKRWQGCGHADTASNALGDVADRAAAGCHGHGGIAGRAREPALSRSGSLFIRIS